MRVWFNRTFSSVSAAISLIREADTEGRFHLIYSNANPHVAAARVAHEFHDEPTGLDTEAYIDWCLAFCREHKVDIFIPGKASTALAAEHARFAAQGTRVLSAAAQDQLELIHDKARFYAATDLPGAPVAQFRPFETLAQFDAGYAELRPRHAQAVRQAVELGVRARLRHPRRGAQQRRPADGRRRVPHRAGRLPPRHRRAGRVPHHAADGIPRRPRVQRRLRRRPGPAGVRDRAQEADDGRPRPADRHAPGHPRRHRAAGPHARPERRVQRAVPRRRAASCGCWRSTRACRAASAWPAWPAPTCRGSRCPALPTASTRWRCRRCATASAWPN